METHTMDADQPKELLVTEAIRYLKALQPHHWLGLVFLVLGLQCIYRLKFHPLSRFPGPKFAACSSFYFLFYITKGRFPQQSEKLFDYYNSDVLRVAPNQVLFRSPQALKDLISRSDVYRGDFALRVIGFTSQNVSNIQNPEAHKRKRKLMNPGFSNVTLAKQESTLIDPLINKFVDKVESLNGAQFDVCSYFDCVTSDIVGKLAFGADFGMIDDPVSHPFLHVLPDALRMSVIAQCIPEVYRFLSYMFRYGPPFLVPRQFRGVADFTKKQMKDRTQREQDGSATNRADIMSVILDESKHQKDPLLRMDQQEVLGEATTIVTGGGDTVATALSLTFWNLMQHQDVYKTLQDQIRSHFTEYEQITSKDVANKLPLVDAVLNESMRTNPVLPGPMWRRTDHDIAVDGVMVPGGTEVGVNRLSVFQNKSAFHNPEQWIPERFMKDLGDNIEAFQPFGLGPRTCIGRYIAMLEMRLILTKLLWRFDWETATRTFDNPEYVVLYRSPLIMKATPRQATA